MGNEGTVRRGWEGRRGVEIEVWTVRCGSEL
jgi:hypothetical protein